MTEQSRSTGRRTGHAGLAAALRWAGVAEQGAAMALIVMVFVLILIQVAQRFLPVSGWVWSGELARYGLVWLTFVLAGYLTGRDEHIALELVDYVVKGRPQAWVKAFANLVVAAISVGFVWEAWTLVTGESRQTSPALGLPLTWVYTVPLVGFTLTALHALLRIVVRVTPADDQPDTTEGPLA